jgi:hypothetical protein
VLTVRSVGVNFVVGTEDLLFTARHALSLVFFSVSVSIGRLANIWRNKRTKYGYKKRAKLKSIKEQSALKRIGCT